MSATARMKAVLAAPCLVAALLAAGPAAAQGVFVRGDCDDNVQLNITDPIFLLTYLFLGGTEPICLDACDSDDSGQLDITDPIYVLNYLFLGTSEPRPPFPLEDPDPTDDLLSCANGKDPPADFRVVPRDLVMHRVGNSHVLTVLASGPDGALVDVRTSLSTRYTSSDPLVASVSAEGVVTAEGTGSAELLVRYLGVTRTVSVRVPATAAGAPSVTITSPADGSVVTSSRIQVAGVVSDPAASLTLQGSPLENALGSFRRSIDIPPGTTRIEVVASGAGGTGRASARVTRVEPGSPSAVGPDGKPLPVISEPSTSTPDTTPPSVSIGSPSDGARLRSALVSVTGSVDDLSAEVRVNGVLASREGLVFRARVRAPLGDSTIRAEAVDALGNRSTAERRITVDAAAPRLALTAPPVPFVIAAPSSPLALAGIVDPPGTPVTVNGSPALVQGASWSAQAALSPGGHDLVIQATLSGSPPRTAGLVRRVIIDNEAPIVELVHPTEARLAAGYRVETATARFAGRVWDPGIPRDAEGPITLSIGGVAATVRRGTFLVDVPVSAGFNDLFIDVADARGKSSRRSVRVERGGAAAPSLSLVSGDGSVMVAGQQAGVDVVIQASEADGRARAATPLLAEVVLGDAFFASNARSRSALTGSNGRTTLRLFAGLDAGFAVVSVSAAGHGNSPVAFVVTVNPAAERVLAAHGARRHHGSAGLELPAPLEARLLDPHGNEIAGSPIVFRVVEGSSTLVGGAQVSAVTGARGVASARAVLPAGRDSSSVIEATHPGTAPVRFTVEGLVPGPAADTVLAGIVTGAAGGPAPGAIVSVGGRPDLAATADAGGAFRIPGAPGGDALLLVELPGGSPVPLARAVAVPGRENFLDDPVRAPDGADFPGAGERSRSESVSPTRGALLSLPALPGLVVEIEPGAARFPDGSSTGRITLAAPNLSTIPGPTPDDTHAPAPIVLLPQGVVFDPPARLSGPAIGSSAGRSMPLFVHGAAGGGFSELPGGVTGTAALAVELPAAAGLRSGGFFFLAHPGPLGGRTGTISGRVSILTPGATDAPQREGSRVLGFNVYAHSGELFIDEVDLELPAPGRGLPYAFRRRYESRHAFRGSLGWNWEHEYEDRRIHAALGGGNVIRATGRGGFDEYLWDAEAGVFVSPPGVFARLFVDPQGFLVERDPDGLRHRHHPLDGSPLAGRLESVEDADGNRIGFARDPATGLIGEAIDVVGRKIAYDHDAEGRIESITDFTGRTVRFAYDSAGDLVSVTSPVVTSTPTDNNFPDGRKTSYVYASGRADDRLNHNLEAIIDPREEAGARNPRVRVTYGEQPGSFELDRVVGQEIGGTNATGVPAGGAVTFIHEGLLGPSSDLADADDLEAYLVSPASRTTFTDAEGRATEVVSSGAGLPLVERAHTVQSFYPRDPSALHPPPGTAPPFYETRYAWTREGLLATRTSPRGDRIVRSHDEDSPVRHAQCALLREEHWPAPLAGGAGDPAVTTWRREPLFGEVVETVPPRGNEPGADPARFASRRFLEYQEGADLATLSAASGIPEADLAAALARSGVALSLGDLNGDGAVARPGGRAVRETPPTATLPDGSTDATHVAWSYNRFGQPVLRKDAAGETRFEYHPETDPDGDGTASSTPGLDPSTGGFLAREIREPGAGSTTGPALSRRFTYDARGYPASRIDGNGNARFLVHSPLGELVEERLPAPLRYRRHHIYDLDGNLVRFRIENYTPTDAGGHFLSSENRWLDTDIERDILGRPVAITREVSGGEVGPARSIRTEYRWHPAGALARIIHPVPGSDEAFAYDERNLLVLHARGAGTADEAALKRIRDENGDVVLEIDAADSDGSGAPETTELRRDGFGRVAAVIDPAGGARVLERDIEGRILTGSRLGSAGGPTPAGSDGSVLLSRECFAHDERGRLVERTRFRFLPGADTAEAMIERFHRDAAGRIVRTESSDGTTITRSHDGAGRLAVESGPGRTTRRYLYDGNGNVVREIREHLSEAIIHPDAATGDPDYDADGRFRETQVIVRAYDPRNRLTLLVDPAGGTWRARYDASDNRTFVSDAGGTSIDASTDPELSLVLSLLTPLQARSANDHGNRRRYVHDNIGRLVESRHELRSEGQGGAGIDPTNPFDRDGIITEKYEWDDLGRLAAWTNDPGNRTALERDGAGLVKRKTWPDGTFAVYDRDRDGNLRVLTDENGTVFRQRFDALHGLVERTIERAPGIEGTAYQRFERDGLSRVTLAFDGASPGDPAGALVLYRRDSFGDLVEETQGAFTVGFESDLFSRRISTTYPDGRVLDMPRDSSGRIESLADGSGEYAAYRWFGSGLLLDKRIAPGLTLSFLVQDGSGVPRASAYDAAGEVLDMRYRDGSGEVRHGFEYGRDRNGHKLYEDPYHRLDDTGEVWRYDSVYRIKEYLPNVFDPRVPPVDPLEKIVFYPDGNHSWRLLEVNFSQRALAVNARSAYTRSGSDDLAYDARGNLRSAGRLAYVHDALGRLVRIERSGTPLATYRYDAHGADDPEEFFGRGRRVEKDVRFPMSEQPAGKIRFVFDGEDPIEERGPEAQVLRQYIGDENGRSSVLLHGTTASPEPYYLLLDEGGSVTAVLDRLAMVKESLRYGPFGQPHLFNSFGNPSDFSSIGSGLAFGGRYHDYESALLLPGARHFDTQLGRHLTERSPLLPSHPLELNGYIRPALPGLDGEVSGEGSRRRAADWLAPFAASIGNASDRGSGDVIGSLLGASGPGPWSSGPLREEERP